MSNRIYILERASGGVRTRYSEAVLMHEILHQFGADDHYDNNPEGRPDTCIMDESWCLISSDTVICSGCMNDILSHIEQRP